MGMPERFPQECMAHYHDCCAVLRTLKLDLLPDDVTTFTRDHARRAALFSLTLGMELGLQEGGLRALGLAAMLHDIGKIGVAERILRKRGALTQAEKAVIVKHPQFGAGLIAGSPYLQAAVPGILYHHCWYRNDQKDFFRGYPRGITGEDIPLEARIIAVADAFDAMTSDRPYRMALSGAEALRRLTAGKGGQFDPAAVEAFLSAVR